LDPALIPAVATLRLLRAINSRSLSALNPCFIMPRLRSAACLEKLLSAAFPKSQIGNRKSKFFNA